MIDSELFYILIGLAISLFIVFLCSLPFFYSKESTKSKDKNKKGKVNYEVKKIKYLTKEQIDEIHKKGYITQEEKLKEIEEFEICMPGDAIGSAAWRCDFFGSCHECLRDYVASKDEWEPFDFKLVNSTYINEKDFLKQKLE